MHFEESRVYVEFKSKNESVLSNVNLGVYLAVQMRLLRIPIRLDRYNARITREKLEEVDRNRKMEFAHKRPILDSKTGISFSLNASIVSKKSILLSDDENITTGILIQLKFKKNILISKILSS